MFSGSATALRFAEWTAGPVKWPGEDARIPDSTGGWGVEGRKGVSSVQYHTVPSRSGFVPHVVICPGRAERIGKDDLVQPHRRGRRGRRGHRGMGKVGEGKTSPANPLLRSRVVFSLWASWFPIHGLQVKESSLQKRSHENGLDYDGQLEHHVSGNGQEECA